MERDTQNNMQPSWRKKKKANVTKRARQHNEEDPLIMGHFLFEVEGL